MPIESQGPPTPAYIFRGHAAAIHALHFFYRNHYFVSGDGEGWIVIWKLTTKRPAAVWKAHDGGVMGIKDWAGTRLITHGRDHKLRVWQVREQDFGQLSKTLPVNRKEGEADQQPWLVHSLDMNALNFCAFSICGDPASHGLEQQDDAGFRPILLASPNGLDSGGVDVFQLPSEKRISKLQSDKSSNTGMVMALQLFHHATQDKLMLVIGYEDGQVAIYSRKDQNIMPVWVWEKLVMGRPHTQPVLSLDVLPDGSSFITSSADATIAKYSIPVQKMGSVDADKTVNTKHAGQQGLKVRNDGRILATAGWDKNIRVYSAKTLKELAVLQWHQEGCYALAFADTSNPSDMENQQALVAMNGMERMKLARDTKTQNTHWLVAGSKDGKISLWDIY